MLAGRRRDQNELLDLDYKQDMVGGNTGLVGERLHLRGLLDNQRKYFGTQEALNEGKDLKVIRFLGVLNEMMFVTCMAQNLKYSKCSINNSYCSWRQNKECGELDYYRIDVDLKN